MRVGRVLGIVLCAVTAFQTPGATAILAGGAAAAPSRPVCNEPTPVTAIPPGVDVTLELSARRVRRGQPLRFEVTVRNNGPIPIAYRHGGLTHDFWVRDERGLVWLWSQGKAYTDQLEQDYLWPGESRSGRTRWGSLCAADGRSLRPGLPGPGRYVGRALWVSEAGDEDGAWWSNEVSFRITR